jgi:hypothetical protein
MAVESFGLFSKNSPISDYAHFIEICKNIKGIYDSNGSTALYFGLKAIARKFLGQI